MLGKSASVPEADDIAIKGVDDFDGDITTIRNTRTDGHGNEGDLDNSQVRTWHHDSEGDFSDDEEEMGDPFWWVKYTLTYYMTEMVSHQFKSKDRFQR